MNDAHTPPIAGTSRGAREERRPPVRLPVRVWIPFPASYPLNDGLEHVADFPRSRT